MQDINWSITKTASPRVEIQTSLRKSMDLNAPSYQTAKGVYNKLRRDVDDLTGFTEKEWNNVYIKINDYSSKKLEIAIQDMKITAEQRSGIKMVREYAKEKEIEITITVVK